MLSIRRRKKKKENERKKRKRSGVLPSAKLDEPVGRNPQQREVCSPALSLPYQFPGLESWEWDGAGFVGW